MLFFSFSSSRLSWLRADLSISICLIILFNSILSCPSPSFSDCNFTNASRSAISSDFILLISSSSSAFCSSDFDSVSLTCAFSWSSTSLSNKARDNCSFSVTISSLRDDCFVSSCSITWLARITSLPNRSLSRPRSSLSSSRLSRWRWSSVFAACSLSSSAPIPSICSPIDWRCFSRFCFSVPSTSECALNRSRSWFTSDTFWRLKQRKMAIQLTPLLQDHNTVKSLYSSHWTTSQNF